MNKLQKVAVLGGTGKAGSFVVKELINQGISIRLLVRNPESIVMKSKLIEIVSGNARSYSSVRTLLTGCNAVISALGNSKIEKNTCSTAVANVIKVMNEIKIKRYVEIAGLAIDAPDDKKGFRTRLIIRIIKMLFPEIVNDRQRGFDLLNSSTLDWTIIRCPSIELTNDNRPLKVSLTDSPGNKISAYDLAVFISEQLKNDQYHKKCPFVAN